MSFASPWLLLGLLGLAVPIAAHLLGRKDPEIIAFAALRFLEPSEPRVARRRQLHDRWLLLLRVLVWAALVIGLARPFSVAPAQLTVYGAVHDAVILLDTSASMQLREGDQRRIDIALDRVAELSAALPPGSRVALLTSDAKGPSDALASPDTRRVDNLQQWVDAQLVPHARPLADALEQATALLGPAEGRPQVIYAVSDPTGAGLASLPANAGVNDTGAGVALIPIQASTREDPDASSPSHVGLGAVQWAPARELDPRSVRIRVPVRHEGGTQPVQVEVALEIDGQQESLTQVTVEPDSQQEVEFTHTLIGELDSSGAAIRLLGLDDALPVDDHREFWIDAGAGLRVTVVNGDPSERREFDEVYFLVTAIRAADPRGRIEVRGLAPDQLAGQVREALAAGRDPLSDTDVLVLANVPPLALDLTRALQARVQAGLGLWLTVGDRVTSQDYNSAFGELLPLRLRSASYAGTAPGRTSARVEGLAPTHLAHPAFAGLGEDLDLASTRTQRLFLLEPDAARDTDIALSFASGAPALVTRNLGRGRVAMLTTSVDRDWSDLALRAGFVPLVARMLAWLGGHKDGAAEGVRWVGDSVDLPGEVAWIVKGPDGVERPTQSTGDSAAPRFTATRTRGLYEARPADSELGAQIFRRFAVQVDPAESDTRRVGFDQVALDEAVPVQGRRPRWREFLALAALLLAFEAWLRTRAATRVS